MDKFVSRLLLTASLFIGAFFGNASIHAQNGNGPGHYGGDHPFRIGMGHTTGPNSSQFGPNSPGTPQNAPYWNDVGDWQVFLIQQGMDFYPSGDFTVDAQGIKTALWTGLEDGQPNGSFDADTEQATREWQFLNKIPITGIVDDTTYKKAIQVDPTFKKTTVLYSIPPGTTSAAKPTFDTDFKTRGNAVGNGIYLEHGHGPHGPGVNADDPTTHHRKYWSDVSQWQHFLKKCGGQGSVLGDSYPNNNFDDATTAATINFQKSNLGGDPVANPNGKVDQATLDKANQAIQQCHMPLEEPAASNTQRPATDAAKP